MTVKPVNCPYCDAQNFVTDTEAFLIFPYPTINPPGKFLGTINYSLVPTGTQEITFLCEQCHNNFSLLFFKRNPDDPIYRNDVKNYIDSLMERKQIEKRIPLFERFLKGIFNLDFFDMKSRLFGAYLLISAPLVIFLVFQQLLLHSISLTFKDYPFLIFFLLFGLLVYLFGLFIDQYHSALNATNLPLLLGEQYKKSPYFHVFEEWRINFFNYGYHSIPFTRYSISHPSFIGLISSVFYLIFVGVFLNLGIPIVKSSIPQYDFVLSVGYLPFWLFFLFFFGYISTMLLHTSGFLVHLSENTPLEFNPLKKNAGFDSLGKISGLIILQISILGSMFIILLYDLWRMGFLLVDFVQILNEPSVIILGLIMIIILTWIYIVPLFKIIKKYQTLKNQYLDNIRKQIECLNMCSYYGNRIADINLAVFKYDKANSLPDWPLPIQINIIISLVISLVSLFATIIKIISGN